MNVWKSFAANEVTHSMAHYLTTLLDLHERRGYARVTDIAKELDVTKPSVTVQLKQLKEKGMVSEDENRHFRLTSEGQAIAREVIHNRQVLIRFFQNVLEVDPVTAETDACKIEHLLSRGTSHKLLAFVLLLQSEDLTAKEFVAKFKEYKVSCPTLEFCNICSVECLMDMEPAEASTDDGLKFPVVKSPPKKAAPGLDPQKGKR
ncbi:MAG: metal-dependent transcriptional regulator [Planctomycetes bacterium]|nr:metal-dependent transcriptional regulator [Planctomycetota bacterium]